MRTVHDTLKKVLNDRIRDSLPPINAKLSEAFTKLTEHPVYDEIYVPTANLPSLEMRVRESDSSEPGWQPAQVLNGQALSALELVPYFALPELTNLPVEVYLMLLDDPTQSFDKYHIELLIGRLAELGHRLQLVVASEEVDDFRKLLPKYFGEDEYSTVSVTGYSKETGPSWN